MIAGLRRGITSAHIQEAIQTHASMSDHAEISRPNNLAQSEGVPYKLLSLHKNLAPPLSRLKRNACDLWPSSHLCCIHKHAHALANACTWTNTHLVQPQRSPLHAGECLVVALQLSILSFMNKNTH